ncbi:MAG TPA: PQQ-binding-like beta-propeller repeat protein [Actinomycetota bacterium]|jgi:outer membrane protein assembly factor BamB
MSSAVLVPGLAVATGGTRLFGIDPESGKVLWSDIERVEGPLAPPAIDPAAGLVVFTEGNGPGKSAVVAADLASRSQRWRFPIEDISRGGPTIADGTVFVGSRDRFVYAIDAKQGTLRWKKRLQSSVEAAPAVAGGRVYAVSENGTNGDTRLYALDAATGRSVWSYSPRGVAIGVSSPTVAAGTVFVGFGDAQVRAFDAETGTVRWSAPIRGFFSLHSSLAFSAGDLYTMDENGGVYRLDGKSGELRWDFQFPSYVSWSSPLVLGSTIYVGMDDGTVAGIDISSGRLVWKTRVVTGPIGAFVPAGHLLLTTSNSPRGAVLAFRHDPSGALLDVPSPTELDVPAALLNFAGSFVLVSVLVVLLFRLVIRPRPMTEVTYVPGSVVAKGDLAAPDSEDDLPDDAERRDDETAYPTDD